MEFGGRTTRLGALVLALTLGACSTFSNPQAPAPVASAPPVALAHEDAETMPQQQHPDIQIIPGTGKFVGAQTNSAERVEADDQGGITLNFINADLKDVAKAILGDYLKLNYEITGNVQGTVTLQTSTPLTRAQVLPALEEALRTGGMALVHSNGLYKVVPLADAAHSASPVASAHELAGYGTEAVPVHYISALEMQKLLEPLAPAQGLLHADSARNLVIIEGTAEERKALREDVALFDVDWLAGMSFGLFTPNYTDAQELTRELNQVLGGMNSPILGLVRLVPIDRLNTILAISPQERYIDQLRGWVERLDRPGQGSNKRIFVYHVQNGRASDVASTLAKALFGGNAQVPTGRQSSSAQRSLESNPVDQTAGGTATGATAAAGPAASSAPSEGALYSGPIEGLGESSRIGSVNITADETNNALVIYATPPEYGVIHSALLQLDTAPTQVFLEAAIAEITLTDNLHYGVQYLSQPNAHNQIVLTSGQTSLIAPAYPGFSYMFLNGTNIQAILDTLSTVTKVEVISSPELMVLNNQTASLQVGDRVPIATQQAVGTLTNTSQIVNSIEYQDTGVILKVTPRVNRGGVVMMDISQEVSGVTTTTSSDLNSPTIQERKVTSSVAVQDGQTVALGGLITNNKNNSSGGLPFLSSIPVIGGLFGDTQRNSTRTELMVLITPHVVDNVEKANAITAELRRRLPAVEALMQSIH